MPWTLALFRETPALKGGELTLSDRPGFGLEFDEAAMRAFRAA
jgi:L-alanine-DL-glutamate epimerase-like enolase superfamily enzyme